MKTSAVVTAPDIAVPETNPSHIALTGFLLSLLTAVLWGVLPLFLNIALAAMDAVSITWYRFFSSGSILLLLYLANSKGNKMAMPKLKTASLILLATLCLCGNYVLYVVALLYLPPEAAQVLIQLAPFLLMLGGVLLFKESFSRQQKLGATILFSGFLLFFNDKLGLLFQGMQGYAQGIVIMVFAALAWSVYALLQKPLFKSYSASQLTLLLYLLGAVVLAPWVSFSSVVALNSVQAFALAFCCLNTLFGYGAFTKALQIWDASRVSAVVALAPIFTIVSMAVGVRFFPQYFVSSELNTLAYVGAVVVVIGSVVTAVGKTAR